MHRSSSTDSGHRIVYALFGTPAWGKSLLVGKRPLSRLLSSVWWSGTGVGPGSRNSGTV